MLKHGILGLLNYGPMTGYEIKEVFQKSLNYFWTAQTSQIYRELQTLKKNGWVTDTVVPQEGKPDKKPFTITVEGKEELLRWLGDSEGVRDVNSPLLMRTFFLGELPVEDGLTFFERIRERSRVFCEGLDTAGESVNFYRNVVPDGAAALYWQMTIEYGAMYGEMLSRWAESCIAKLKEARKGSEEARKGSEEARKGLKEARK